MTGALKKLFLLVLKLNEKLRALLEEWLYKIICTKEEKHFLKVRL